MEKENRRRSLKRTSSGEQLMHGNNSNQKVLELEPPRRRSARLIAISKPIETKTTTQINKEENSDTDQFESLENLNDPDWKPKILFDENRGDSAESKQNGKKRSSAKTISITGDAIEKKKHISLPMNNLLNAKSKSIPSDTTMLMGHSMFGGTSTSTGSFSASIRSSQQFNFASTSIYSNSLSNATPISSSNLFMQQKLFEKMENEKEINSSASSNESEEDWEAMEPVDYLLVNKKEKKKTVEIRLEGKAAEKFKIEMNPLEAENAKQTKEREKWEHCMRLEIERRRKQLQEDFHRIHILSYIGHLRFMLTNLVKNYAIISEKFKSIFHQSTAIASAPINTEQMQKLLVNVFRAHFRNQDDIFPSKSPMAWCSNANDFISHMSALIDNKSFHTDREVSLLFFAFCVFILEIPVRLCVAFNPIPKLLKYPKYLMEENSKKTVPKSLVRNKPTKGHDNIDKNSDCSCNESDEELKKMKMHRKKIKKARKVTTGITLTPTTKTKDKQQAEKPIEKYNDKQTSRNYWNEYWDDQERRWICVDPYFTTVDLPNSIEKKITEKFLYVLAMDNEFGVNEIAAKYSSDFLTLETRKMRTEQEWFKMTLNYQFLRANESRIRLEEATIIEHLKSKPLPIKLSEYKNHPLYALERDLLKFEAIYPPNTTSIGRVGKHDVFPRSTVHKLEGSLNWIKESRSIKENEEPYKIVKARPKLNVPKEKREPLTLDLFGYWQTEPYRVPVVVNGRIPRNEFGNIYVYKPEMLPKGCVHLRLPGIYQLARRFDLEAVPAVVGWEFSGGFNHPILDGCVVLQENAELLRSAWKEMSRKKAADDAKKRDERIWKNWRRLIRGKILLEQMRKRFNYVLH